MSGPDTRERWATVQRISRRAIVLSAVCAAVGWVVAIAIALVPEPARSIAYIGAACLIVGGLSLVVLGALTNWAAHIAFWWLKGPSRWGIFAPRARRAALLAQYDWMAAQVRDGLVLVRVVRIYQSARRGTKCVVEHRWGRYQDAWFWAVRPRAGDAYLVRARGSYGPHNDLLDVLYVGSQHTGSGVIYRLPRSAWRAARRRHLEEIRGSQR